MEDPRTFSPRGVAPKITDVTDALLTVVLYRDGTTEVRSSLTYQTTAEALRDLADNLSRLGEQQEDEP